MDKLISQQAAINVVSEITTTMSVCTNKDECYGMKRMQKQALTELANLPSAEPEAISKWKKEFREYVDSLDIARDDWKGIIEYIGELPSVQPNHCAEVGKKVLIDRQEALETIRTMQTYKLFEGDDMILIDKAQVQTELMMLPSAQPETNCSEFPNNSATISRTQAIDAMDSEMVSTNPEHFNSSEKFIKFMDDADIASFGKWQWANGFNTGVVAAKIQLKKLPSAQPERTCVNCGRTANNGGWYADGGTRCPIEEHYALPKDGYCHLWEKRNVTDDDYPERREE